MLYETEREDRINLIVLATRGVLVAHFCCCYTCTISLQRHKVLIGSTENGRYASVYISVLDSKYSSFLYLGDCEFQISDSVYDHYPS